MHRSVLLALLAGCGRIGFGAAGDANAAIGDTAMVLPDTPTGPISFVQASGGLGGAVATVTASLPLAVGPAHTIIVGLDLDVGGPPGLTLTDSLGDIYTVLDARAAVSAGYSQYLAVATVTGSGIATITATATQPGSNFIELRLLDYTGLAATNVGDGATGSDGIANAATTVFAPPIVTSGPNELVVGMLVCNCASSEGPGATLRSSFDEDTFEDAIVMAPGAKTMSSTLASSGIWRFSVAALRGL